MENRPTPLAATMPDIAPPSDAVKQEPTPITVAALRAFLNDPENKAHTDKVIAEANEAMRHYFPKMPEGVPQNYRDAILHDGTCLIPFLVGGSWLTDKATKERTQHVGGTLSYTPFIDGAPLVSRSTGRTLKFESYDSGMAEVRAILAQ